MRAIMVRYGEIALKGEGVRRRFENKLIRNIEAALDVKHEIRRERGRIFVYTSKIEEAVKKLKNVFGIVSLSPCTITDSKIKAISEELLKTAKTRMQPEESFALRVRRAGTHDFSSQEVARKCGERIVKELGVKVDLVNPNHELFVEIRQDSAYIYTGVQNGFGGMPLGTQGSVVSLISGGIDSPVATFLIMKRGCKVLPVHFDAAPMSDEMSLKRAEEACAKLREYSIGEKFELTVFPFCEARIEIVDRAPDNLTCVLCKRGMLKVAEKFAIENRCQGIVTGENLGQVASQTLLNLSTITYGFRLPILRPLITYDKNEIVNLSRKISTYKISIQDALCCTARPLHPATSSNIDRILEVEKEIDFEKILRKVYRGAKRIK